MVRHKNRWLLVKIELVDDIRKNTQPSIGSSSGLFPSKKEFTTRLRRTVAWCFGIAGEAPACDTLVRFCDPDTQLAVVRVPRQYCNMIRSSLTLLLTCKQLRSLGETADTQRSDYQASVISIHGSARTTKIAIFRKLREIYRRKIRDSRILSPNDEKLQKHLCRALQERLISIQNNMS